MSKRNAGLTSRSYSLGIKNNGVDGFISYEDFKLICEAISNELPKKTLLTFNKTPIAFVCGFDCTDSQLAKQWTISVVARIMVEFDNTITNILFG